jgi:NADH-quinone oxidoreductase subunit J
MTVAFYLAGGVAVISTVAVITQLNAVHALLYLIVSLLAVAVVFFTLGAPFVAALEVIVYAGAIMVLFLFVIMILNLGQEATAQEGKLLKPSMWLGPGVLALVLVGELVYVLASGTTEAAGTSAVEPREVGVALFSTYLLGVELASVLLLAGLVGAYHLGRRERTSAASQQQVREAVGPESGSGDGSRGASGARAPAAAEPEPLLKQS